MKNLIVPRDVKTHLKLWRACAISTYWKRVDLIIVGNQRCRLILETKLVTMYVDHCMHPLYYPFPNLVS